MDAPQPAAALAATVILDVTGRPEPATRLYTSANLAVRAVPACDTACWIVTFDHFTAEADLARPGFAEAFLRAQGWSAIHVLGSGNDWYQYDDLPMALAAIRAHLPGTARVVAYGSSMGAYAALHCADAIGADAVVALSPQYSNDPQVVPWERRWLDDAVRIRWRPMPVGSPATRAATVVLFDPANADRHHASRIVAETGCTLVALPHAGHPVTTFLGELNLLRPLLAAMRSGEFDPLAFRQVARCGRGNSATYLSHLALAQPACRPALALNLAERAWRVAPGSGLAMHNLATVHRRAGRHADAIALLEEAVVATRRCDLNHLYALAEALLAAGYPHEATARMGEAIALAPGLAYLRVWQARALFKAGSVREAAAMQASAVALVPQRRAYRARLRHYRARVLAARAVGLLRQIARVLAPPDGRMLTVDRAGNRGE